MNVNRRQFLATTAATAAVAAAPATRPPNIVLLYADDVGYGDLSCYGATKIRTPNLDKLAGGGLRFTNAHSSSATCTPSRYSLLTGEYAWRKPGTAVLPGDAKLIIPPGRPTLPSILKGQGYRTAAVGKWHLGLGGGANPPLDWNGEIKPGPLEVGFDYCFIIPATGDRVPCVYVENHRVANLDPVRDPIEVSYDKPFPGEPTGKDHPELLRMKPSHGHDQAIVNGVPRIGYMRGGKAALWNDETMADTLTAKALGFMEQNRTNPFFLYFATHDIHVPRLPNPRFAGKSGMGPRGDALLELDRTAGQVLDSLDRLGLAKDTLVLFSSDNGPVVDDGYQDDAVAKLNGHKPAGPLRGGKYSNFDGGTRVPLLARWPGRIAGDGVSSALFSQVDLAATLGALAGAPLAADAAPDSMNMLPALLGQSKTGRPYCIEHAGELSIIEGDWKLISPGKKARYNAPTDTELGNDPEPQLYDLAKDPGEKDNVAAAHPDITSRLATRLAAVRASSKARPD